MCFSNIDSNNGAEKKALQIKTATKKPWLDHRGHPICDDELKVICQNWDKDMWEKYLSWLDYPLKESQISPESYDYVAGQMEESIFYLIPDGASDELKEKVRKTLEKLTDKQRMVIHKIFWEGKSERQIAAEMNVNRSVIFEMKKNAFRRISKLWGANTRPISHL
ncbi:MAG: hypothetical protein A2504_07520 [Bdellovibrionales bacterium RIFOXYD12_FULL_39_22]|nr:MAG: hypothetical protein A2385_11905 [Bdellovibrionales bacterium RIFOXYB1_FULL_39_21]OFZ43666.1 MAG: hypothetical protein A2485_15860 [Bdellovibrionales bacterium RIFOXYC12_FULL_39_17]OFZ47605.1 MAG: hypothetical protein A2404_01210 [Bdellovibrionales bacterium RIFOXYC1_FULL_39_130]OFZ76125.1 MAG: hypothetical protein A2560_04810 [Bdellovibrionales bacterium RIFOXYD1_FULL_39_84]OFZ95110.1 MAG: hypothetical protein A2504_07520 [Bdellovibrionales bacterium RIFOXYD12_FULL_39_22]